MAHWIQTFTGHRVNVFDPDPQTIRLVDISRGLSNTCRFAGQIPQHYSVGQHSLIMSLMVPPDCALEALMHDAAEAYLGDVPKPVKEGLPDYRRVSEILEAAIALKFGLVYPWPDAVHVADRRMVLTEAAMLGRDTSGWGVDGEPYGIEIGIMKPDAVNDAFMARAMDLIIERNGCGTAWKGAGNAR
jgi:hypothetical protein